VKVTVTHTLNAHFVEVAVASTVQFEHEGIFVTVATATKPDGAFATITCAGMSEVDDEQHDAERRTNPASDYLCIVPDQRDLFILPDQRDRHYAPAVAAVSLRIEGVLRQVGSILRWRFGLPGYDAVFKDTYITAELIDGRQLHLERVSQATMGDDSAEIEQDGLAAVAELVTSSQHEPVAHELWREAWNLRDSNPRSSLVIGVAAAEVGLKQLVAALAPETKSLIENLPSPSLDVMIRKVLPDLPIRADVEPGRRAPNHLRKAIVAAVEDRNRLVHLGAIPRRDLRATLLTIRDFLYLLDFYSGQPWAETLLTDMTRSSLVELAAPRTRGSNANDDATADSALVRVDLQ
jgi:hypothetical protein